MPRAARRGRSEAVRAYDCQQAAADWMHAAGRVIDTSALTPEQALEAALAHLHLTAAVRPRLPEVPQA
ncbi:hypothetical protein QWJ26_13670 [Streptomyces sp. CSDS2]|uniref:hypothetical protein n=1 Tax=Streptomyces sp. CSDS2 TaxID=3055051 RepID=UPI0025AF8A3B|nr:hypothetical protein [Streptomyces sp. CSDS2]MDN3260844.1 hypothetical protein [Streptomyces sp. CSDS2]